MITSGCRAIVEVMTTCLGCGTVQEILIAIDESDSGTMSSYTRIYTCPGCGHGELRHYSYDAWGYPSYADTDHEEHMTWSSHLDAADLTLLRTILAPCPAPHNPRCPCPIHSRLRAPFHTPTGTLLSNGRVPPSGRVTVTVATTEDGLPELN
jgi:hypothetical protein